MLEPTNSARALASSAARRAPSKFRAVATSCLAAASVAVALIAPAILPAQALAASGTAGKSAVIDYSSGFTASTPATLKAAHVGVVIRYVGSSAWKCLTPSEAASLRAAGIDIATVYESTASWMLGGRSAGVSAAKAARAAIIADGGPTHPFVYFACDTDTNDYAAVNAALEGAQSVLGADSVGIYGGYNVCESALESGSAVKAWQTLAWSSGQRLPQATLVQLVPRTLGDLGVDYDTNLRYAADIGQWSGSSSDGTWSTPAGVQLAIPAGEIVRFAAQSTPTTETLRAIESTDGVHAWAVGDGGTILHTGSGGTTWTVQSTPTTASLDAVHFIDGNNGWAVGERGTVFRTADGGLTWDGQSTPTTATLKSVAFANPNVGWAVGEHGTVVHTIDGGVTWLLQSTPTTATIDSVQFSSATTGMAVGEGGQMLFTGNGGASWFSASTPTTATLNSLHLADQNVACAVGASGTVLYTGSAGATWSAPCVPTTMTLNSVRFADPSTGMAVGATGTVLFTQDGGRTWQLQAMPTMATLNAVTIAGTKGWAVGDLGAVLRITLVKPQ